MVETSPVCKAPHLSSLVKGLQHQSHTGKRDCFNRRIDELSSFEYMTQMKGSKRFNVEKEDETTGCDNQLKVLQSR